MLLLLLLLLPTLPKHFAFGVFPAARHSVIKTIYITWEIYCNYVHETVT
jgi:hypothetical protein